MVIAFDFDGCLSTYKVQQFAKKCITEGNEVWVVTKRRSGKHNVDLEKVLKDIRLPLVRVIFTDDEDKFKFIRGINADLYIDNDSSEFLDISNMTNTLPVFYH